MENLRITPNPATDVLRIQRNQGTAAEITVFDTQGRIVLRDRMTDTTHPLDVHALKPGIYVLRINAGNDIQSTRFVKE
ncbi:MAG: T9SS type A sorting domain-containing protein [Flavobacteriales bacterium]|nr:T9SS type A sorting domain-containing protein [Flavobacteriales bacterium]